MVRISAEGKEEGILQSLGRELNLHSGGSRQKMKGKWTMLARTAEQQWRDCEVRMQRRMSHPKASLPTALLWLLKLQAQLSPALSFSGDRWLHQLQVIAATGDSRGKTAAPSG